jgi:hypothetical protein
MLEAIAHQLGITLETHLLHQAGLVCADRLAADRKLIGDVIEGLAAEATFTLPTTVNSCFRPLRTIA